MASPGSVESELATLGSWWRLNAKLGSRMTVYFYLTLHLRRSTRLEEIGELETASEAPLPKGPTRNQTAGPYSLKDVHQLQHAD